MRIKILVAIAVGAILISVPVPAFGHHRMGHQSPNTPYWGIPEEIECDHIMKMVLHIEKILSLPGLPEEVEFDATERLNLLLATFAARCRVL